MPEAYEPDSPLVDEPQYGFDPLWLHTEPGFSWMPKFQSFRKPTLVFGAGSPFWTNVPWFGPDGDPPMPA